MFLTSVPDNSGRFLYLCNDNSGFIHRVFVTNLKRAECASNAKNKVLRQRLQVCSVRLMFLRLSGGDFQDVGPRRKTPVPPYVARLARGSPVRHDEPNVGDDYLERWTRVGRVPTGIQAPCCVDTCTPGHTL